MSLYSVQIEVHTDVRLPDSLHYPSAYVRSRDIDDTLVPVDKQTAPTPEVLVPVDWDERSLV